MTDDQYCRVVATWTDPLPQARPEMYIPGAALALAVAAWMLVFAAIWVVLSWL